MSSRNKTARPSSRVAAWKWPFWPVTLVLVLADFFIVGVIFFTHHSPDFWWWLAALTPAWILVAELLHRWKGRLAKGNEGRLGDSES